MRAHLAALALAASPLDFEQRAAELESRSAAAPRSPDAAPALAEAALLRLGLGEDEQAEADARALGDRFGRRRDLVASVALARARQHAGLLEWERAREVLLQARPALGPGASIDDRLEAHALLGRASAQVGRPVEAALEYRRAIALEKRSGIGPRGRDAVAEAWLHFAERAEERARALRPPLLERQDRASVIAYLEGPASRWLPKKRHALEAADVALLRVLGVVARLPPPPSPAVDGGDPNAPLYTTDTIDALPGEPPSPRLTIAALARSALGWATFVKELRSLPAYPRTPLIIDGEEVRDYICILSIDPPELEHAQRAKRACARALDLGLAHRISDENTRACELWLSRSYRAEYHVLDELRPRIAGAWAAGQFAPVTR